MDPSDPIWLALMASQEETQVPLTDEQARAFGVMLVLISVGGIALCLWTWLS